jgi:hypothetical protein
MQGSGEAVMRIAVVVEVNDDLFPVSAFPRGFEFASAFFITECIHRKDKDEDNTLERKWFLTVYGGLHAQKTLGVNICQKIFRKVIFFPNIVLLQYY